MNLESDKRLNIQLRLDFSSAPTGEARQAGREDIESRSAKYCQNFERRRCSSQSASPPDRQHSTAYFTGSPLSYSIRASTKEIATIRCQIGLGGNFPSFQSGISVRSGTVSMSRQMILCSMV